MKFAISWSLLATVYWLRDEMEMNDQCFFAGDMPIRLLCPFFNKGQISSSKRYNCRERNWYCNIDDTEIR